MIELWKRKLHIKKKKKKKQSRYLEVIIISYTYFSKSGAKSAALDSLENPVTYNVFFGIVNDSK